MELNKIQQWGLLVVVLIAAILGVEYRSNRRGPVPFPDEASRFAGQNLLEAVLKAHHADSWDGKDTVTVRVDYRSPWRDEESVKMGLNPSTRSADFVLPEAPNLPYHWNGAEEKISPRTEKSPGLARLAPSFIWWSLIPRNLTDRNADVWRIPDARRDGRIVQRLAARWQGELEWFVFEIDPDDSRIHAVEFIDERLTPLFRWRGVLKGESVVDGTVLPVAWTFSPAHPAIRFLTGGRSLVVLRFGPVM